ncbi:MAG: hypothetical protein ONB12_01445 [candidate division KSB1 bacterium]|nr:hypothetical protein [candidate division KSB1 bacterium]
MKLLFICGSLNQTTQLYQISRFFSQDECFFSPFYLGLEPEELWRKLFRHSILGGKHREATLRFLTQNNCAVDKEGKAHVYDAVFTCTDLFIQRNIRNRPIFLIQEGMTDPERKRYRLYKAGLIPRWMAGTSTTGLSNAYTLFFVASEGYKELFVRKGADPNRIRVTGIPNFDNFAAYKENSFPMRGYVLAVTSNLRECGEFEDRKGFIQKAVRIADGRPLVFKLHPAENDKRAAAEIKRWAPGAVVMAEGDTLAMTANCDVFITRQSSVVYAALALGKEVHCDLNLDELRRLLPIQNGGKSAEKIAEIVKNHLQSKL